MADRPIWRGHLRLALVSCPVALFTARRDHGGLHFNLINPATGNRVHMVTRDAETDAELQRSDLVKGYEFSRGRYLLLDEEDFRAARVDSSSVLTVEKFIPAASLDPIFIDATYYLLPDGESGQDVYVVLRDAIARTGRLALSHLVIAQRERVVAIASVGRGLVVRTLHEARDLADPAEAFRDVPELKPEKAMVDLAVQLIDRQTGTYDPADTEDRYETRLRAVIEAKLKGEGLAEEPAPEETGGNVIDLMAALKRSLGDKPAAKAKPPAPAAKTPKPRRRA